MDHWTEINQQIERLKRERYYLMKESERFRDIARAGSYSERPHTLRIADARANQAARISIKIRELARHAQQASEGYY